MSLLRAVALARGVTIVYEPHLALNVRRQAECLLSKVQVSQVPD
jgi:hypothetical protein